MQEGTFKARVSDVDLGFTENGNEQIVMAFELLDGPCQGESINWYGTFTEKAAPFTLKVLRACGWSGSDFTTLGVEDLANDVSIVVVEELYMGRNRCRVKWVNAAQGTANVKNKMTAAQKSAFAQRMKGLAMATPVVAPPKAQKQSTDFEF